MELKAIVVILIVVLSFYNIITYTPVYSKIFGLGAPSLKSVILFIIIMALCIYGFYLNEHPVYLY